MVPLAPACAYSHVIGVGVHVSEGEREGRRLHSLQTIVFHVRDGRFVEAWALHYDQHATDEFWA